MKLQKQKWVKSKTRPKQKGNKAIVDIRLCPQCAIATLTLYTSLT